MPAFHFAAHYGPTPQKTNAGDFQPVSSDSSDLALASLRPPPFPLCPLIPFIANSNMTKLTQLDSLLPLFSVHLFLVPFLWLATALLTPHSRRPCLISPCILVLLLMRRP